MNKHIVTFFQLIPVIISMLLIGAHFLRSGNIVFTAASLILLFGLFIRHPFPARILQLALFFSTVEWIRTAFILTSARLDAGLAWTRLAFILGAVTFFSFASIFVFLSKTLGERYSLRKTGGE